jgi:hypothetical protein
MRETLQAAAKHLLSEPVGTEKKILINVSDGLTGLPPGTHARGARQKTMALRVEEQTKDGRKRVVVKETSKDAVVVTGPWSTTTA